MKLINERQGRCERCAKVTIVRAESPHLCRKCVAIHYAGLNRSDKR